jgi:hypothetical protein
MYLTTKDVKEIYKLSYQLQHKLRAKGLPYIKIKNTNKILYRKEDIEQWLHKN